MSGIDDLVNGINSVVGALDGGQSTDSFESDGFLLPATFSADGNGLPFTQAPSFRQGQLKRNNITWFVPEFGIVRMYVNPSAITYAHKKLITKERTKGGFTLQYWGEDLDTLNISGTTGGAGIEGINALYEIYRAEQYAFDAAGLILASNNSVDIADNLLGGLGSALGGVGSILGLDSPSSNLASQNIPSLAQMAFSVEMFYNGWVYRGFFENMTVNERADNFLIDYQMTFTATQRRGYRLNYFPWAKSAADGPSQYTSPQSFSGNVSAIF